METMKSKIAYVKGLMEGINISSDNKENKVLTEIINIIEELSDKIEVVEKSQTVLERDLSMINEDLECMEDDYYDEFDENYDFDEDDFIELECPNCNEAVFVEKEMLGNHENVNCPNCQTLLIGSTESTQHNSND